MRCTNLGVGHKIFIKFKKKLDVMKSNTNTEKKV